MVATAGKMNVMLQRFKGTLSHRVARALRAVFTVPRYIQDGLGERGRGKLTKRIADLR